MLVINGHIAKYCCCWKYKHRWQIAIQMTPTRGIRINCSGLERGTIRLAVDPGFWSGGPRGVLTPIGALSPKLAQNRGLPETASFGKNLLGASGPPPPHLDPLVTLCLTQHPPSVCSADGTRHKGKFGPVDEAHCCDTSRSL